MKWVSYGGLVGRGSAEIEVEIEDVERFALTLNDPVVLRNSLRKLAVEWMQLDEDERDRQLIQLSQDAESAALVGSGQIPAFDKPLCEAAIRRFGLLKPSFRANLRALAITCGLASRTTPYLVRFADSGVIHLVEQTGDEHSLCGRSFAEEEAQTPFRRGSFSDGREGERCDDCLRLLSVAVSDGDPVEDAAVEPRDYNPCRTPEEDVRQLMQEQMVQAARKTLIDGSLLDRLDLEYYGYLVEQAAVRELAGSVVRELVDADPAERLANVLGQSDPFDPLAAESGITDIAAAVVAHYPQAAAVAWPTEKQLTEMLQRVFLYRDNEYVYELQIAFLARLIDAIFPQAKASLAASLTGSQVPGHKLLLAQWQ